MFGSSFCILLPSNKLLRLWVIILPGDCFHSVSLAILYSTISSATVLTIAPSFQGQVDTLYFDNQTLVTHFLSCTLPNSDFI